MEMIVENGHVSGAKKVAPAEPAEEKLDGKRSEDEESVKLFDSDSFGSDDDDQASDEDADISVWQPEDRRRQKPHCKGPGHHAFSNTTILGPDGHFMAYVSEKKARFYLARNLATMEQPEPLVIKLCFQPKGPGHKNDAFEETKRVNQCVICGTTHNLVCYSIVPRMYREHMPKNMQSRSSHDRVCLCDDCHVAVEKTKQKLCCEIGKEFGIPFPGQKDAEQDPLEKIGRVAHILARHGAEMPATQKVARTEELLKLLTLQGLDKPPLVSESDWIASFDRPPPKFRQWPLSSRKHRRRLRQQHNPHARVVLSAVIERGEVPQFIRRWRQHFVESHHPRFMPPYWSVDRDIVQH
jgi:hypothetical protein